MIGSIRMRRMEEDGGIMEEENKWVIIPDLDIGKTIHYILPNLQIFSCCICHQTVYV